jgi:hypothetical protein
MFRYIKLKFKIFQRSLFNKGCESFTVYFAGLVYFSFNKKLISLFCFYLNYLIDFKGN